MKVARQCLKRKEISVTPTALRQTPKKNLQFLKEHGVRIREVKRRGRPRKLNSTDVKRILAMRKNGNLSFYKIANLTNIPKSTVFDYFKRHSDEEIDGREVEELQLKEAHRIFKSLIRKDIDEEITELAKRGCKSKSLDEVESIMREIEKIIFI
jgi:predicted DNA-binding protein YlxM (UPF0122 family)